MTSDEINALPKRVRGYIHDLETRCNPAGDVQALAACRESVAALKATNTKMLEALRHIASDDWRYGGDAYADMQAIAREAIYEAKGGES